MRHYVLKSWWSQNHIRAALRDGQFIHAELGSFHVVKKFVLRYVGSHPMLACTRAFEAQKHEDAMHTHQLRKWLQPRGLIQILIV